MSIENIFLDKLRSDLDELEKELIYLSDASLDELNTSVNRTHRLLSTIIWSVDNQLGRV